MEYFYEYSKNGKRKCYKNGKSVKCSNKSKRSRYPDAFVQACYKNGKSVKCSNKSYRNSSRRIRPREKPKNKFGCTRNGKKVKCTKLLFEWLNPDKK